MALAAEVVQEYMTSLLDLAVNSKPLINMLTIVAEENEQHASSIVIAIEEHIFKCKSAKKLPVLYLIDSIMKNLQKSSYKSLFSKNIVDVFSSVFEQVDRKTRARMYKLRQSWTAIVSNQKLYMIDKRINNLMDPAWPITATPPEQTSMQFNQKFLSQDDSDAASDLTMSPEVEDEDKENDETEALMRIHVIAKQQELLRLKQAQLDLELLTQVKVPSKKKGKSQSTATKRCCCSDESENTQKMSAGAKKVKLEPGAPMSQRNVRALQPLKQLNGLPSQPMNYPNVHPSQPMNYPNVLASQPMNYLNVHHSQPMNYPNVLASQPMNYPNVLASQPMNYPNVHTSQPSMTVTATSPAPTSSSGLPLDMNSLMTKLVSSGIINLIKREPETKHVATALLPPKPVSDAAKRHGDKKEVPKPLELVKKAPKVEKCDDIADMTHFNRAEMKTLQQGSIQRLYAGMQCGTCEVRFSQDDHAERAEKYRQHLDWHFQQKRRQNDQRVPKHRNWYFGLNDWVHYEEMGDTQNTTRSNFFEQQKKQQQQQQRVPSAGPVPTPQITVPEGSSVTKCPAATGNDKNDMCENCHETFEQYWDQELEEWHLRDAIKVNNKTYHPICYEDFNTDISVGTPAPSALMIKEPDFSTQKSINYEKSTTDSHSQSSFVEVRDVARPNIPALNLGTFTMGPSRYDRAV